MGKNYCELEQSRGQDQGQAKANNQEKRNNLSASTFSQYHAHRARRQHALPCPALLCLSGAGPPKEEATNILCLDGDHRQ